MAKKSSIKSKPRKKKSAASTPKKKLSYKKAISNVLDPEVIPHEHTQKDDFIEVSSLKKSKFAAGAKSKLPSASAKPSANSDANSDGSSNERALSPSDPLRRYMIEANRYPLLEPEEEFQLAIRLRESGDIDAAKKLISANLRLVVKIAFEYKTMTANIMDLIQEGNIGLMKAVSKFDPTKGAKLSYYASWWIRSYILKYILDNFRLVKIGTTQAQKKLFYHLMKEKSRLEAQGLAAGPKLLAEKLEVREKDIKEMQNRLSSSGGEVSIDNPINQSDGEAGARFADLLSSGDEDIDQVIIEGELLSKLRSKIPLFSRKLNDRERNIFEKRILSESPMTLQAMADEYGLTRERIRQIEQKLIKKLRSFMASDFGPMDD